jgi:hypothetical protein
MRPGPGRCCAGTPPADLAAPPRPHRLARGLPGCGPGGRRYHRWPGAARSVAGRRDGRQYRAGNRRRACGEAAGRHRPAGLRLCYGIRHRGRDGSRSGNGSFHSDRCESPAAGHLTAGHLTVHHPTAHHPTADCCFANCRFRPTLPPGVIRRRCGPARRRAGVPTRRPGSPRRRRGTRGLRYARSPGAIRSGGRRSYGCRARPDPGLTHEPPGRRHRHLGWRRHRGWRRWYGGRRYAGPGWRRPRPSAPGQSRPILP